MFYIHTITYSLSFKKKLFEEDIVIISILQTEVVVVHLRSFFFFFFNYLFILLYNIVLVLPYIDLNPPWVHMCSPSWTPLPTPSPSHSSGSSQCTSPISLGLKCVSGESLILQGLARSALRMSMAHGCSSSSLEIPDPPPWQLKMSFHLKLKPRCRALTTGSSAWGSDSSLLNYSTFYFYGELNSQVVVLIFS